MIYLDTHIAIFLYQGELSLFSKKALDLLKEKAPMLSGMAELELHYLYEVGKLSTNPEFLLEALEKDIGLKRCSWACNELARQAHKLTWTNDPFDRMIVANAQVAGKQLLTKDSVILQNFEGAVW